MFYVFICHSLLQKFCRFISQVVVVAIVDITDFVAAAAVAGFLTTMRAFQAERRRYLCAFVFLATLA